MIKKQMSNQICVFMCYTPNIAYFSDQTAAINRRYCKKWGYQFVVDTNTYEDWIINGKRVKPHWNRYRILFELMKQNFDYIMYIDSDACVLDDSVQIENLIVEGKDLMIQRDKHPIKEFFEGIFQSKQFQTPTMNSGVMIWKNSEWSKNFISEMLFPSRSNEICQTSKHNAVSLSFLTKNFDQSCLNHLSKITFDSNDHIYVYNVPLIPFLSKTQMIQWYDRKSRPFIYHAMSKRNKPKLLKYLKNLTL
jgi:hypothetical protein